MTAQRQELGRNGEAIAVKALESRGYRILERNYRHRLGEVDLIAEENGSIVFVEVKTRRSTRFGSPKAALNRAKQRKISMVALAWLKSQGRLDDRARFDVVSIQMNPIKSAPPKVEIIRNAFELAYG